MESGKKQRSSSSIHTWLSNQKARLRRLWYKVQECVYGWPLAENTSRIWYYYGIRCAISRGFTAMCGYVHLPKRHPDSELSEEELESSYPTHHGLTWISRSRIGGWIIGFDVGHAGDFMQIPMPPEIGDFIFPGRIWTVDDVAVEVELLALVVFLRDERLSKDCRIHLLSEREELWKRRNSPHWDGM